MPEVRTDDAARNLTYVWKGPESMPFGFEVRFPTVGVFAFLVVAGWVVVVATVPGGVVWRLFAAGLVIPAAAWVARTVMRHIDADRPVAYYVELLRREYRTPRPPQPIKKRNHRR